MKSIYIAGPITAKTEKKKQENIQQGLEAAKFYLEQGYAVYCPHAHEQTRADLGHEGWMRNCIFWLEKSDLVVFLPGWEESKGARIEHMIASALGRVIFYWEAGNNGN